MKNYKEMCKLLIEPEKNGTSKKAQIKEWECHFDYDKQGQSFIITEIYKFPKSKEDKRVENSLYTKLIELMLMYELSQKENCTSSYTKTFLFYQLGMVNQLFRRQDDHEIHNVLSNISIPNWQFENFYARTQNKLTKVLFSAFNSMKNRKLLIVHERRVIVELKDNSQHIANKSEEEELLEIERNVLLSMGYEKVPFQFAKRKMYYNNVSRELKEQHGWKSFKEFELVYNNNQIANDIPKVKSEIAELMKNSRLELNDKIIKFLNQQAENNYIANCNEYKKKCKELNQSLADEGWLSEDSIEELFDEDSIIIRPKRKDFFKYPDDYTEKQKLLADIFINVQRSEESD